jgi:sugar/nucleoside kinase (ribokinase family)
MIVVIGDLVEDVVVRLHETVAPGDDTAATITRRPGGSASNTAMAVSALGGQARLVAALGDDDLGRRLAQQVRDAGVDVTVTIVDGGRSGTVVVLVDRSGERTMLTDRGCSAGLDGLPAGWDGGITALHVPMYALADPAMARTVRWAAARARSLGATVSVDVSSARLVGDLGGRARVLAVLDELGPDVVLANDQEADALDLVARPPRGPLTVVKRGARPAVVIRDGRRLDVPAEPLERLVDSTGAGDAFAAGLLVALGGGAAPVDAVHAGHRCAAAALASRADA